MKTIALFVPQYHSIPLNDQYWGEGFTEWVNVKNAKPLFEGHVQPKTPLNNNYYDLLDDEIKMWQMKLAKDYGIYGFCYYHYWFNGEMLLEKPVEQILQNKAIDLPFCFCWANEPWTMEWVGEKKTIMPQFYGEKKEWKDHFDYLLPFFRDDRYIKNNGKPLMVIYRAEVIECLNQMLDYWQELAVENGLPGLEFAYQHIGFDLIRNKDDSRFTYDIEYEPAYSYHDMFKEQHKYLKAARRTLLNKLEKHFGIDLRRYGQGFFLKSNKLSYDDTWENILNRKPVSKKSVPCAFVGWDNTPRYKEKGRIYVGATPEKFRKYFSRQVKRTKEVYKKDMIFIFAWNEWGEGGYLEPDEENGYGYLEAVRDALKENGEFPW